MIFLLAVIGILFVASAFMPSYIIQGTVRMASPILLAGIGGLFSQLAGVLNIALEGLMIFSAFFSIVAAVSTGSLFWGIVIGVFSSVVLASLFASISLGLDANIFFAGLATNLFAAGFTVLLQTVLFQEKGIIHGTDLIKITEINIPIIKSIPILGTLVNGYNLFVYLSWFIAFLGYIVIYKTTFGLRLRSVGENPGAFRSIGLNPKKYQFIAILISGFTCGLAGASLSIPITAFARGMVNNRGWIGLVTIFVGGINPAGTVAASLLFGGAEETSYLLQVSSLNIPHHFIQTVPYVITLIAMVAYSIWKKSKTRIIKG